MPEADRRDALPDLEQPAVAGIARVETFDPVLQRRLAENLDVGVERKHLVMQSADPVRARPDLSVGERGQTVSQRGAEATQRLFGSLRGQAADQKQSALHGA